jgi:hypothetical protein
MHLKGLKKGSLKKSKPHNWAKQDGDDEVGRYADYTESSISRGLRKY